MKKVLLKCLKTICFLGIFCLIFLFFQELLRGKWYIDGKENAATTSTFREYRSLEENTVEALFIGTSHIYYGIDSMSMYEQTGVISYGLGGPGLRMDLTYLGLKEALKTQKPKVVLLDMSAVHYTTQQKEARIHMYSDELTLDAEKIEFAFDSESEELDPLGVMFPLIRYHSRWDKADLSDVKFMVGKNDDPPVRGHCVSYKQVPATLQFDKVKEKAVLTDRFLDYFDRIAQLCEEEGIELVLFKIPTPGWSVSESQLSAGLAEKYGIPYLELYYEMEKMGLNAETDFHDASDHLNQYGAQKLAGYLGNYLTENYGLEDYRGKNERWDKDLEEYNKYLEEKLKKESE